MQHFSSLRRSTLLVLTLLSACAAADPNTRTDDAVVSQRPPPPRFGAAGAYLTARFAATQTDLDFAADQFLRALALEPDNVELQQQAFLTCMLAGRPEAVRLARMQPDSQAAQLLLADTFAKAGQWEQAEKAFAALPSQGLTQVLRPLLVAWAQMGAGRVDSALATLQPYVEAPRFRAIYALHAALIADLGRRPGEAARLFRIAQTEYGGTNLPLARLVASWQARSGYPQDARQTLQALGESSPDLAIALPALQQGAGEPQVRSATDGMAEAYLAMAAALRLQDASEFAVIMLRLSLDLRPDLTVARLLTAEINESKKHSELALRILAPVPDSDPLSAVVRLRRVALLESGGKSDQALRLLADLERDFPSRAEPLVIHGDILRGKKRFAEAVGYYDRAMALIPTPSRLNWPLFYSRAIALERSKQWARAESDFNKALELAPDQPSVLNYLGYSWAEQGRNLPRARQMIERAVEQRPNDGSIIDSLGWVVLRQGDIPNAVRLLERAVELEPEDSTINGHLGDAYWSANRRLEAQFQWRRALTLNPDPEDAARLQTKLRNGEQAAVAPPARPDKVVQ